MIHYLTVQDVLWINHEVTRKVNPYKYAQLEEATFSQYGYGKSQNVLSQAGGFLEGFMKLRPFSEGNRATAFVSALAFLAINGYETNLEPENALEWSMRVAEKKRKGAEAIREVARESPRPPEMKPIIRTYVHEIIERYAESVSQLTD